MKPLRTYTILLSVLLLMTACSGGQQQDVHFSRLEQLLFATPTDQLPAAMMAHQEEYSTDLIVFLPEQPEFVQVTQDFVSDPVVRDIYRTTDSLYHDIGDIEKELGKALGRAYTLCPEMYHVERFYTMVTGDYDNVDYRVYSNGKDICLAIDQYALGAMKRYGYFGLPEYIVRNLTRKHIVRDCMHTLAALRSSRPNGDMTLLDYIIQEGKCLYFVESAIPSIHDTILLRYTRDQLEWMKANVENVCGWYLQNKMLYSTDPGQLRNLTGEAPHTNAFGPTSAPRTTDYIGLHIVRSYMKKTGCTMQQLLEETDSQKILTQSGWRP